HRNRDLLAACLDCDRRLAITGRPHDALSGNSRDVGGAAAVLRLPAEIPGAVVREVAENAEPLLVARSIEADLRGIADEAPQRGLRRLRLGDGLTGRLGKDGGGDEEDGKAGEASARNRASQHGSESPGVTAGRRLAGGCSGRAAQVRGSECGSTGEGG